MGPILTIKLITSYSVSAAAIVVNSAFVSYAGATSTISAATKLIPSSPLMIVLSSRVLPTTSLWRARCRRKRRIQRVDIDAQIHWIHRPNSISNGLDDSCGADRINLSGLHACKSTIPVVVIIREPAQCRPDSCVECLYRLPTNLPHWPSRSKCRD